MQMAVMTGTYLAMQRMSKKNGGSGGLIINTASAAGIIFADGTKELKDAESYFIAKHGVVALTRSLAVSTNTHTGSRGGAQRTKKLQFLIA